MPLSRFCLCALVVKSVVLISISRALCPALPQFNKVRFIVQPACRGKVSLFCSFSFTYIHKISISKPHQNRNQSVIKSKLLPKIPAFFILYYFISTLSLNLATFCEISTTILNEFLFLEAITLLISLFTSITFIVYLPLYFITFFTDLTLVTLPAG